MFEAVKKGGMKNDIALDDITLTSGPCGPDPPDPTNVPLPTTMPPIPGYIDGLHQTRVYIGRNVYISDIQLSALMGPADCGGPFDLWEPNSTFNSPNYPQSYGNKAKCE